jgi:hypothetical protein
LTNSNGKETGGSAFPHIGIGTDVEGMTLRDYFAAKALQGLLADPSSCDEISCDVSEIYARCYYEYADAMLKVRK